MSEELIKRLQDEADLCRNEGADDIASLLDEAANALKAGDAPAFWVPENALDKRERGTLWSTFIANERHDEKLYKLTVPLHTRPAPAVQVPEGFSASVLEDAWCHAVPLTRPHFDRFMAVCREMAAAPAPATVAPDGGVDVAKVIGLVEDYGDAMFAAGISCAHHEHRNEREYRDDADEAKAKIRALLTAAPAIAKQEGK